MGALTRWVPTLSMLLVSLISYIDRNTLALLAPDTPVIALATQSDIYEKMVSNVQEVLARKAWVTALVADDDKDLCRMADDTIVVFLTDNGPQHSRYNGGLRGRKGTVFEGGVRVPFLARWTGKIPAGSVVREPAMTIDVLPTVAKLAGADLPKRKIDGKDVGALLRNEPGAKCPHEAYYFYYHVNELHAIQPVLEEIVRKVLLTYWNTASFLSLYGRTSQWSPATGAPAPGDRPVLDRWTLSELHRLVRDVDDATSWRTTSSARAGT